MAWDLMRFTLGRIENACAEVGKRLLHTKNPIRPFTIYVSQYGPPFFCLLS